MEPVSLLSEAGICWIAFDNPPVNALSHPVRAGMAAALARAAADPAIQVIVLKGAGRGWSAGADIREFGKAFGAPGLPELCTGLAALEKPVIAALHGMALGGGLELALCARLRIAAPGTELGLPEVALGLLPGAGGTQRLPRLIGAKAALGLMLSGLPVTAERAEAMGLVDAVIEDGDLDTAAARLARAHIEGLAPLPTRSERLTAPDPSEWLAAVEAARAGLGRARLPAPGRIIDCVEAALLLPEEEGHVFESEAFAELMATPEAMGLRHAFLAERRAAHLDGSPKPRAIGHVGLVGMGGGGAALTAAMLTGGLRVTAIEGDAETLTELLGAVASLHDAAVAGGRLTAAAREAEWERIDGSTDLGELRPCDMVILSDDGTLGEVARILGSLAQVLRPEAVRAVISERLDPAAVAAAAKNADVLVLRPVPAGAAAKLVEVAATAEAAPEAVATGLAFARRLGRVGVATGAGAYGIAAEVSGALRAAMDALVEAGASPYDIDRALAAWGYARGPYQTADAEGLDGAGWLDTALRAAGRGGRAAGRGAYRYAEGARLGSEDADVLRLIDAARLERGIVARPVGMQEIQRRALAVMANAGARAVEAGLARRPSDVDAAMVAGQGFPRWRGGPMAAADQAGLLALRNDLRRWAGEDETLWQPVALWDELIKYGRRFGDLDA